MKDNYPCNFCRREGDTFYTANFDRLVEHYRVSHQVPSGRVYAMFGKVRP